MKSGRKSDFQPNVMMLGLSSSDYVLRALSNVTTNDLEQTLLVCVHYFSHHFPSLEIRMIADIFGMVPGCEFACASCVWLCMYI